jgi:hypothetical protein
LPSTVTGSRAGHPLTAIILRPWLNGWTNYESLVRAVEQVTCGAAYIGD